VPMLNPFLGGFVDELVKVSSDQAPSGFGKVADAVALARRLGRSRKAMQRATLEAADVARGTREKAALREQLMRKYLPQAEGSSVFAPPTIAERAYHDPRMKHMRFQRMDPGMGAAGRRFRREAEAAEASAPSQRRKDLARRVQKSLREHYAPAV